MNMTLFLFNELYPKNTTFGFQFKSVLMRISVTTERAEKIKRIFHELLQASHTKIRDVIRVLGTLPLSLPGVMYDHLHYCWLEIDKIDAPKLDRGKFDGTMTLSSEAIHDLRW